MIAVISCPSLLLVARAFLKISARYGGASSEAIIVSTAISFSNSSSIPKSSSSSLSLVGQASGFGEGGSVPINLVDRPEAEAVEP